MSDLELQKLLGFNEGDLAANRMGRMSARQAKELEESSQSLKKYGMWIGIALVLLALGISAFIYYQEVRAASAANRAMDYMHVIPGVITVVLVLGVFAAISFAIAFVKINTTLGKAEGKVNFVKVEKRESYKTASGSTSYRDVQQYELRVGDTNFNNVPEEYLNVIEEGDIYAFYYLKEAKHILSAERISTGK